MVIALADPLLVIVTRVAEKKSVRMTPEAMSKLLRLNDDFDRIKIGLTGEGDINVRVDVGLRTLDAQEFKDVLELVVIAADTVDMDLKPFRTKR